MRLKVKNIHPPKALKPPFCVPLLQLTIQEYLRETLPAGLAPQDKIRLTQLLLRKRQLWYILQLRQQYVAELLKKKLPDEKLPALPAHQQIQRKETQVDETLPSDIQTAQKQIALLEQVKQILNPEKIPDDPVLPKSLMEKLQNLHQMQVREINQVQREIDDIVNKGSQEE